MAAGFIALPGFLLASRCCCHPSLRCQPLLARGSLYHFPSDLCPADCNLSFTPRLWVPPFSIHYTATGWALAKQPPRPGGGPVKFSPARLCGNRSHCPAPVVGCRGRVLLEMLQPTAPGWAGEATLSSDGCGDAARAGQDTVTASSGSGRRGQSWLEGGGSPLASVAGSQGDHCRDK